MGSSDPSPDDSAGVARIEALFGRPCPFPKGDQRRASWLELGFAMLEAHERFKAEFTERSIGASTEELAGLAVDAVARQFDMIAGPVAATTTDYSSATERESGLKELSGMVLAWFEKTVANGPSWMRRHVSVADARVRLAQRTAHWTAEALRLARETAANRNNTGEQTVQTISSVVVDVGANPKSQLGYPERGKWLQEQLDARSWSVHDLQRHGGPSWKTSRKVINGNPVQLAVLEKLAQVLSLKGERVRVADIPQR